MAEPLWRQIMEGTYDPFSSSFSQRSSGSSGFAELDTDWRAFQAREQERSAQAAAQEQAEREALELRGDEYVNLAQAQGRLERAVGTAEAFGQEGVEPEGPGTVLNTLGTVFDTAKSVVVGGLSGLLGWDIEGEEGDPARLAAMGRFERQEDLVGDRSRIEVAWERALNAMFGGQSYGFGDFGALRYDADETSRATRTLLGGAAFILDTAFDPLTYASLGSSIFGRVVASTAVKASTKALGREALEAAGEAVMRREAAKLGVPTLASRLSKTTGTEIAELVVRDADSLVDDLFKASKKDFSEAAIDGWSMGNAAAYGARGRTGLWDRMVSTLGEDSARSVWRKLEPDIQGGLRWRVPFRRVESEITGMRMPTVVRFPFSEPGRGFDKLGMGTVTRKLNQARLALRTGPAKFVENVYGRNGKSWTKVLLAAKAGDAEAVEAYAAHFSDITFNRNLRIYQTNYDRIAEAGMKDIATQLQSDVVTSQDDVLSYAGDAYFKRGRADAPTPQNVDQVVGQNIAARLFQMTDQAFEEAKALYGEDAVHKIRDYATRMMTPEGLDELVRRYGVMPGKRGRMVDSTAGRRYSSFPKEIDVDENGNIVVTAWYTGEEVERLFGRAIYITDPVEAVGEYLTMMRRELSRDWALKKLKEDGLLIPVAADVIKSPSYDKILTQAGKRLAAVRAKLKKIEDGEQLSELEIAAVRADVSAGEKLRELGRLEADPANPNVLRSADGMVEIRRDVRGGGWLAYVNGEPVVRPVRASQYQLEGMYPDMVEVNWDAARGGFFDENGQPYAFSQVQLFQGLDDKRWVVENPQSAARRAAYQPPKAEVPLPEISGVWKPWLDRGDDESLEYVHKQLLRKIAAWQTGASDVTAQEYAIYGRDLALLLERFPQLRGMNYDGLYVPSSDAAITRYKIDNSSWEGLVENPDWTKGVVYNQVEDNVWNVRLNSVQRFRIEYAETDGTFYIYDLIGGEPQLIRRVPSFDEASNRIQRILFDERNAPVKGGAGNYALPPKAIRLNGEIVGVIEQGGDGMWGFRFVANSPQIGVDEGSARALMRLRYQSADSLYEHITKNSADYLTSKAPSGRTWVIEDAPDPEALLAGDAFVLPKPVRSSPGDYQINGGPGRTFTIQRKTDPENPGLGKMWFVWAAESVDGELVPIELVGKTTSLQKAVESANDYVVRGAGREQIEEAARAQMLARRGATRTGTYDVSRDLFEETAEGPLSYRFANTFLEVNDEGNGVWSWSVKELKRNNNRDVVASGSAKTEDEALAGISGWLRETYEARGYASPIVTDRSLLEPMPSGLKASDEYFRDSSGTVTRYSEAVYQMVYGDTIYTVFPWEGGTYWIRYGDPRSSTWVTIGSDIAEEDIFETISRSIALDPPKIGEPPQKWMPIPASAPESGAAAAAGDVLGPRLGDPGSIDRGAADFYSNLIRQAISEDGSEITPSLVRDLLGADAPRVLDVAISDLEAGASRAFHGIADEADIDSILESGIRPYQADEFGGAGIYIADLGEALEYSGRLTKDSPRRAVAEVVSLESNFIDDEIAGFQRLDRVQGRDIAAIHIFEQVSGGARPVWRLVESRQGNGLLGSAIDSIGMRPATGEVAEQAAEAATERVGLTSLGASRYRYVKESGESYGIAKTRVDGQGREVWEVTDADGVRLETFDSRKNALNFIEGRPLEEPVARVAPEVRAMITAANTVGDQISNVKSRLAEMAEDAAQSSNPKILAEMKVLEAEINNLHRQLDDLLSSVAFDSADAARRLIASLRGLDPDVRSYLSDRIEDIYKLSPAAVPPPRPRAERGSQQQLMPPGPGEDIRRFSFNSQYDAEYHANRAADRLRSAPAKKVREDVWETNRAEIIAKLEFDARALGEIMQFDTIAMSSRDKGADYFNSWMDYVIRLVKDVDDSIDPIAEIVDRTKYVDALRAAGYDQAAQKGIDEVVAGIMQRERLYAPEILQETIRRHFRQSRDLDGAEQFYQNFWRPYYTASKSWMTQGRGYGYTARNIIGSMYNAWLADVRAVHFRQSGTLLAARRDARAEADKIFGQERVAVAEGESLVQQWEEAFDRGLRQALRDRGLKDKTADYVADAYKAFVDNDYGGRSATSRIKMELLDRGSFDPIIYDQRQMQRGAELFPGKSMQELNALQKIANASIDNPWIRHVTRVNEGVEDYLRFAAYLRGMDSYGLMDDGLAAGTWVKGTQFDYADLSDFERKVLKNIIPFYTWTRYNVPLQIRSLWMEPGKVSRLLRFHEEVMKAWTGEAEDQEMALPEWLRRRGGWMTDMRTPMTDPESALGDLLDFKQDPIAAFIESPLTDLSMLFNATLNPLQLMNKEELINQLNPLIGRTIYEFLSDKSYVSGREFREEAPAPNWAIGLGLARKNDEGEWVYNEKTGATIKNLLPPAAQLERLLAPFIGDEKGRRRWLTTLGSQLLATPLYTVDPNQQAYAISEYASGMIDAIDAGVVNFDDQREIVNRLLDRGFSSQEIATLGLGTEGIDPSSFNFEELDRARRNVESEEELSRFLETLPTGAAEAFIARRGFRGRTGAEAVEAWRNRQPIDVIGSLELPEVGAAFSSWFARQPFGQQLALVYRYGYGPYRGAEAVARWQAEGGLPNRPPGLGSADFLAD